MGALFKICKKWLRLSGLDMDKSPVKQQKFFDKEFLLASIALGFLFVLPHLSALLVEPSYNYFQTDLQVNDDFTYATRYQAYASHVFNEEIMTYEHRNDSYPSEKMQPSIFLVAYSAIGNFFHTYLFFLFIGGFFIGLTFLNFTRLFFKDKKICMLIVFLTVAMSEALYHFPPWSKIALRSVFDLFFLNPEYFTDTVFGGHVLPTSLFYWARPYYQLFNYPLLFLSLYFLAKGYKNQNKTQMILAGTIFGIFAYSYIYFFIISGMSIVSFFIYSIIKKHHNNAKLLVLCGIVALAISLPYLASLYEYTQASSFTDTSERAGVEQGHNLFKKDFILLKFIAPAIILFALGGEMSYVLALLLISFTTSELLHAITGKMIQVFHFQQIGSGFLLIAGFYILVLLYGKYRNKLPTISFDSKRIQQILTVLVAALILYLAAIQSSIGRYLPDGETPETYANKEELFSYIRENTAKDSVIATLSIRFNLQLSTNLHRYVFLPNAYHTTGTKEETFERILLAHKFCNANPQILNETFIGEAANRTYDHYYYFHQQFKYNPQYGQIKYPDPLDPDPEIKPPSRVPTLMRQELLQQYDQLTPLSLVEQDKYKINYFIIGPYEKSIGCTPPTGESVFSNDQYELIKLGM